MATPLAQPEEQSATRRRGFRKLLTVGLVGSSI